MSVTGDPDLRLSEVDDALARGWTIPANWYADPAIHQLEIERIFASSWALIGPAQRLANPGDHVIANAGHVPVVVTRDLDGRLQGFVNVCRHRAHPVALADGNRRTLQCRYHGWTYELDGRLRAAPRCDRETGFDTSDLGLVPVAVDSWRGFIFVNPDADARPLTESHPELDELAAKTNLDFSGFTYRDRWSYDIPANWKVWVENATECYHCPTVHRESFSDAFDTDADVYELIETGSLLCQFTRYQPREGAHRDGRYAGMSGKGGFRFIYLWPTSFWAQDDYVAFTGMIIPTGVETCRFIADVYSHPDADEEFVQSWMEMYNQTLIEDKEVVLVQQPGLRSNMVPHGRLLPRSESPIMHFHQLVRDALAGSLPG
jgi:phenylpropionate dioxygenase-like ring-hydroxylating dioxygenase large terminal subunit